MSGEEEAREYRPRMAYGVPVPGWLLCRPELTPEAKLIFALLIEYTGRVEQWEEDPESSSEPDPLDLEEELGLGKARIQKAWKALIDAGLLSPSSTVQEFRMLVREDWLGRVYV
jgi:hypothetical protein